MTKAELITGRSAADLAENLNKLFSNTCEKILHITVLPPRAEPQYVMDQFCYETTQKEVMVYTALVVTTDMISDAQQSCHDKQIQ